MGSEVPSEYVAPPYESAAGEIRSEIGRGRIAESAVEWRRCEPGRVLWSDLDISRISLKVLAEIKSLRTDGFFRRRPIIPPTIQLQLTHLRLASDHPSTSAFLERLLGAEPVLTHLEFSKGVKDTFSQSYNSALHDVARQLLHSTLPVLQCGPTSFNTLDFVASCTSLKSLTLRLASPTSIYKTFASSHAALTLVTTRLNWKWNEGGQGFAKLIAVLELAAVAELKRWRLTKPTVVYMNEAVMGYEHTQAAWEDACRARGVDPRDERRFFTDYPAE